MHQVNRNEAHNPGHYDLPNEWSHRLGRVGADNPYNCDVQLQILAEVLNHLIRVIVAIDKGCALLSIVKNMFQFLWLKLRHLNLW